jgi:hypothetical protein
MKPKSLETLTATCLLAVFVTGCPDREPGVVIEPDTTRWLAGRGTDEPARNAIIRQHTLYDYHFVPDAAELNELGQQSLDVLIAHFQQYPGELRVRRGSAPLELYDQRIETLMARLAAAGLTSDRVRITEELPGGDGLPSGHMLKIAERRWNERPFASPASGASNTGTIHSGRQVQP